MIPDQQGDSVELPFPLEIVIGDTPLSAQSKNATAKARWKVTVARHAQEVVNRVRELYFLDERALMATIYYFPPAPMDGDIDNIVKPVLDGMRNVAYPDDRFIERVVVQKFEPGEAWAFSFPTVALASVLDMDKPALYIRLDDDLAWRQCS